MKTKVKRLSKRSLAILIGVVMLITSIGLGSIITANAYTGAVIYYKNSNTGQWSSATSTTMNYSNPNASITLSLSASTTYYFIIKATDNNDWWGNNSFDLSGKTSQTNYLGSYYNFSSSNNISNAPNTLKTSNAASYTITFNMNTKACTASGGNGGAATVCSTDKTYRIVGTANIAGSAWANTATANNMTYSSTYACYTKTYSNVAAGTMDFRIIEGSTWSQTWGFDRANKKDDSNIVSAWSVKPAPESDNNIRMTTTEKANIEIRFDDSKTNTSAITVIVTPAVSTVTAGSCTGGTVTVNGSSSASNIAYGGSVSLVATPSANYHFVSWDANDKLSYGNSTNATTTATVTGTATVTATFAGDSFSVTKASGTGYTITAPTAGTAAYNSTVSVSATASSDYYIDGLYYETGSGSPVTIYGSSAHTTNSSISNKTFTMPASNVTIYAWAHEKDSNTVNYGVCTGQTSYGYVSVGEQYSSEASTMKHTIDSGTKVLEGTKVNFCARPAVGYVFVGWYDTSANTGGTKISSNQDYTETSPSGNYYARFRAGTDPAKASSGVRLLFKKSDYSSKSYYIYTWSGSTQYNGAWHGKSITSMSTITNGGGTEYYYFDYNTTSFTAIMNDSDSQSGDISFSAAGTYTMSFDGGTTGSKSSYTEVKDGATTAYFPVKYYVTNPEKGASTVRSNMFAQAGGSITFYHSPSDTTNWKTSRTTTSFSSNLTNDKTTSTSTSRTMPSTYSSTPTFTVTFIEKEYHKVTYSAGAGGTLRANITSSSGTAVTSGQSVQEGKVVYFTATPKSGYEVAGWICSGGLSSANPSNATSKNFTVGTADTTVRVYFKKSQGTSGNTATYFGYAVNDTNPVNWTNFATTFVRNGRVYGYINNNSAQTTYDFQAYEKNPSNGEEKYTKQYYRDNDDVWADTKFTGDITFESGSSRRHEYANAYNGNCYFIQFTASAKVKAIMIDLGPVESSSSNKARPDNDENTYHIIPIYNTDVNKVTVYAKDATFRDNDAYDYMPSIADTVITTSGTDVTNRSQQEEFETAVAKKGKSITVTTTISSGAYNRDRFFVKGFSFNGVTNELLTEKSTGVYSTTFTIPADYDYDYLEITPVYFIRDSYLNTSSNNTKAMTFYIENYDQAFQDTGWGNTLAVYPFYSTASSPVYSKANVFGGYPGLPVINYGGRRFVQVPTQYKIAVDNEDGSAYSVGTQATIKGITLNNYYYDIVHRDYCQEVNTHLQTYDYDDFYVIYKETTDGKEVNHSGDDGRDKTADQITFAFKHRTSYDNFTATKRYSAGDTLPSSITTSTFTNGWEDLLDYHDRPINIFGKQLTTSQAANDPIYVVSNGYEYTRAGYYATTWTVYNSSKSKIGTILPSALIVSTKARMIDNSLYPDGVSLGNDYPTMMQFDDTNTKNVYDSLKNNYADRPVKITYEKAIKNSSESGTGNYYHSKLGEISTRTDGRWYYSYMNEKINANLRIDYAAEDLGDETEWTSDTFKGSSNRGSVTGATVQFTNTEGDSEGPYDLEGLTDTEDYDGDILTNFNHYFKFSASQGSGYIFKGWYFEKDGICTEVNPDDIANLAGESQMTSNATFVARYIKNPSGHLTINHSVSDDSLGDATTYVGVKAVNRSTGDEYYLTGDEATEAGCYEEDTCSIDDATYTSYKSGYTFVVLLKTETNDFTNFVRFSSAEGVSSNYFSTVNQNTVGNVTTTYFEVDSNDLFALDANSFPVQQFDTLDYYSHLNAKTFNYNFNYTYPAYLSKYGTQGYRQTGTFTYDELTKYMEMSGGTTLQFKDAASKTALLNKLAPYEDNFMQEINWNTSVSTSFSSNTISATVPAVTSGDKKINLTFKFNYNTDSNYQPVANATYTSYKTVTVASADRPSHLELFKKNDEFVTAPRSLMNGETEMVFRYWSVTNVPDEKHSAEEYTRCYDNVFNLALFQDSIIETVYTAKNADPAARDGYDPDAQEAADATNGIKISFMENSRNQYNDGQSSGGAGSTAMTSSRATQGDRMYTDFLLNFNNVAGNTVLKDLGTDKKRAGLIIEPVGDIDYEDGQYVTKTEEEYREIYGETITEIGNKLSGDNNTVDQLSRLQNFISNAASGDKITGIRSEFDVTELDNKNRRQYAYSIANRSHSDFSILNNRYKVYRAYAYIADVTKSGSSYTYTNVQISNKPTYFTIYDMASIGG